MPHLLTCCDWFCRAGFADAIIPRWCDGDVVSRPTVKCHKIAAVCAAAVILVACSISCTHCVNNPGHVVGPGNYNNSAVTVHKRKEGRQWTGSWPEEENLS